jgi:addiction module HigA family antidote
MMRKVFVPTHEAPPGAGEILVEEFLKPMNITQTDFANRIGVTFHRLNEIVNGRRGVSTDTALRFSRALGTTPDLWLNIQRSADLYQALHSPKAREIAQIQPISEGIPERAGGKKPRPKLVGSTGS